MVRYPIDRCAALMSDEQVPSRVVQQTPAHDDTRAPRHQVGYGAGRHEGLLEVGKSVR